MRASMMEEDGRGISYDVEPILSKRMQENMQRIDALT